MITELPPIKFEAGNPSRKKLLDY